jgi:hypothetical protein
LIDSYNKKRDLEEKMRKETDYYSTELIKTGKKFNKKQMNLVVVFFVSLETRYHLIRIPRMTFVIFLVFFVFSKMTKTLVLFIWYLKGKALISTLVSLVFNKKT